MTIRLLELAALGFSGHGLAMCMLFRGTALAAIAAFVCSVGACGGAVVLEEEEEEDSTDRPGGGTAPGRPRGEGGSARCASPPCSEDVCPPTLPVVGDECADTQVDCSYPVTCGEALAVCEGLQWQVDVPICP